MKASTIVYVSAGAATVVLVGIAVSRLRQRAMIEAAAEAAAMNEAPSLVSDEAQLARLWAEQQRQQSERGPVAAKQGSGADLSYATRYRFITRLNRRAVERKVFAPGAYIPGVWLTERQLCGVASDPSRLADSFAAQEYLSQTYTPDGRIAQHDPTNTKWRRRCR